MSAKRVPWRSLRSPDVGKRLAKLLAYPSRRTGRLAREHGRQVR